MVSGCGQSDSGNNGDGHCGKQKNAKEGQSDGQSGC